MALTDLRFDNSFTRELPADPSTENRPRPVRGAAFTRVQPTQVAAPKLLAYSREVAALLDLTPEDCEGPDFAAVFSGNAVLPGMDPYAACYGGHQFGNWAGQLGDGRAISLGEVKNERGERWELQLKGAGPTPYSRTADGRAVLRSSLREFLCSEAMHHLGIPTTRALSLVSTGDRVVRDILYDGHPKAEPGAVVCRVAPSFLRFGNLELPSSREDMPLLRAIAAYLLKQHYPELGEPNKDSYVRFLEIISERTAQLVSHWQRVGFVHGVMNTDNMSLLGLTIDYGPYGFLEDFDADWTPNITDAQGRRYRYQNQPRVAYWNLVQLANALHPLVGATEPLEKALEAFPRAFDEAQRSSYAGKLGIRGLTLEGEDLTLISELLERLTDTDFTIFFRSLAHVSALGEVSLDPFKDAFYGEPDPGLLAWLRRYQARIRSDDLDDEARRALMNRSNPKYILRNYLAQQAIDKAEAGDASMIGELLACLRQPYDEQPEYERFYAKRPEWARNRAGCSMLSCSS
ncbi:MAG TPA: YdiU family protein [Polyangiales bacterium]|nr:YdiU family protein [Polyangiales bacterium]